jgi:lipoprotein-releasing system permease protein
VLSAFDGLKDFGLSFANQYDPDLKVIPLESKRLEIDEDLLSKIKNIEGVDYASLIIEEKTILSFKEKNVPAILKAIDSNYVKVSNVKGNVFLGQWLNNSMPYQVVLGNGLSRQLSIGLLDQSAFLDFIVPKPGKGQIIDPTTAFKSLPTMVRGIFGISEEYNNTYVFCTHTLARDLLGYKDQEYSSIEIALAPNANEELIKTEISNLFPSSVEVKNRLQLNEQLYKMLNAENLMVYLISTLVIIIALFNLIGSIIMSILDKKENIITLSHLGATPSQISFIFFLQGMITCVLGSIAGISIGAIVVWLQLHFGFIPITATLAYPVKISIATFLIVLSTTLILGVLASKIASSRASKLV